MNGLLFSHVSLGLFAFAATFKNITREDFSPDVNITCMVHDSTLKIYCEEIGTPLNIEFIAQGKTVCHINRSLKQCGSCKCDFISTSVVMIESKALPQKDEVYGCQMIFHENRPSVKIYRSVLYDGTEFIKQRKEVQPIGATFNVVTRQSPTDNTYNERYFLSYNGVILIVVLSSVIFSFAFVIVFYANRCRNLYHTVSTRGPQ